MARSERTFRLPLVSLREGHNVWASGDTTLSDLSTNTISLFCRSLLALESHARWHRSLSPASQPNGAPLFDGLPVVFTRC